MSRSATFHYFVKDGEPVYERPDIRAAWLKKNEGKRVCEEVDVESSPRAINWNRYYYGLCDRYIAPALTFVLAQKVTKDDAADWCAYRFLPPRWVDGVQLRPPTHTMKQAHFEEFVERIREFFLHDERFRLYLPTIHELRELLHGEEAA